MIPTLALGGLGRAGSVAAPVIIGGGTDPYIANVVALLHFTGADGSTTFTDQTGKTWTANGDAQINAASGLFDGTGDYIDTPDSADWDMAAGDFTWEAWLTWNSLTAVPQYIAGQSNSSSSAQGVALHANAGKFFAPYCYNGSVTFGDAIGSTVLVTGHRYHLAYVRAGTDFWSFVDGAIEAASSSALTVPNIASKLAIGRLGEYAAGGHFNGRIDQFRITKGVARYTSAFTPPAAPFPDS